MIKGLKLLGGRWRRWIISDVNDDGEHIHSSTNTDTLHDTSTNT